MVGTVYLDTSAFIKLHDSRDSGSAEARRHVRGLRIASSVLLYAEAMSAVARKRREDELTQDEVEDLRGRVRRSYRRALKVQLTTAVLREAEQLVFAHPLRAADAIHVASALLLARTSSEDVSLVTGDSRMEAAASAEALPTVNVLRGRDG